MNNPRILLSAVAALFVTAVPSAAQATFTTVKGTETIIRVLGSGDVRCHGAAATGNPFMPCPPGVSGTVRGRLSVAMEDTTDDRLNGLNYITANANMHSDGIVNIWGTFRLEVTSGGVWEGVWEGKQSANGVSFGATGHGTGGNVEGLQLLWDANYPPGLPAGSITVRILAPNK